MPHIEIYTSPFCPYCHRAKALLDGKAVAYEEIDVVMSPQRRDEMQARAGGSRSVPQIFVDGTHIGDSERLLALDRAGELDGILGLGQP
jgi:glutaredoxin 3